MRGFGPSNVFHYFSTMHPKPNELFSGSVTFGLSASINNTVNSYPQALRQLIMTNSSLKA